MLYVSEEKVQGAVKSSKKGAQRPTAWYAAVYSLSTLTLGSEHGCLLSQACLVWLIQRIHF